MLGGGGKKGTHQFPTMIMAFVYISRGPTLLTTKIVYKISNHSENHVDFSDFASDFSDFFFKINLYSDSQITLVVVYTARP